MQAKVNEASNAELFKQQLNKVDVNQAQEKNQSVTIDAELSAASLSLIKIHTENHQPLVHKLSGGEMFFLTEAKKELEIKSEEDHSVPD